MVRFTNPQARALLTRLIVLKREVTNEVWNKFDLYNHLEQLYRQGQVTREQFMKFMDPTDEIIKEDVSLDDVIETVTNQLGNEVRQPEIIDAIVTAISERFSPERLSGETLRTLRKNLLDPSSLDQVKRKLRESMSCSGCGHAFDFTGNGEVATLVFDGLEFAVKCTRCSHPVVMSCSACSKSMQIPQVISKALGGNHRCDECRDGKGEEAKVKFGGPFVAAQDEVAVAANNFWRHRDQNAVNRAGRRPVVHQNLAEGARIFQADGAQERVWHDFAAAINNPFGDDEP